MSDKTHCDLCDALIPPTETRLTLQLGCARGDTLREEEYPRDICDACVGGSRPLTKLAMMYRGDAPDAAIDAQLGALGDEMKAAAQRLKE